MTRKQSADGNRHPRERAGAGEPEPVPEIPGQLALFPREPYAAAAQEAE